MRIRYLYAVSLCCVSVLFIDCVSDKKSELFIGIYNIGAFHLAVEDTTIDYRPSYLLFLLEDNVCDIPARTDLLSPKDSACTWSLYESEEDIYLKINSVDSLFNDPFEVEVISYHYYKGEAVGLKEFTLTNKYVFIEAYIY